MKRPLCILLATLTLSAWAAEPDSAQKRQAADRLFRDGNFREALEGFKALALAPDTDPRRACDDLGNAVTCYQRLNESAQLDAFLEKVVAGTKNWRLLQAVARQYFDIPHQGFIIAGQFERGGHRGGGRYVNSFERDRVRALQIMNQALPLALTDPSKPDLASFHLEFARFLLGYRGNTESWRLQYLTDLSQLPDYDEGYSYYSGGQTRGAPTDVDGNPVFHKVPLSYETAASDGERWRWMLARAMEYNPERRAEVLYTYAMFLNQQFGVETMADYGWFFMRPDPPPTEKDKSGPYALESLGDHETIARLAVGIRRFALPDDANAIRLFRAIAAEYPKTSYGHLAMNQLGQTYENRRQYDAAVTWWEASIRDHRDPDHWKQKRIEQIVDNWGEFEPVMSHPAGQPASVEFRFRNGRKVHFTAHAIKVVELLRDVKEHLASNPRTLNWERIEVGNIGYRLVTKNQDQYIAGQVAEWDLDLEPRPKHFDRRITVETPLRKPGAYLLTGKMEDGNTSRIIIWINDTVIVKKQLNQAAYFFVADAVTGTPVPKAAIEGFGYRVKYLDPVKAFGRHHDILTTRFAESTDEQGQLILKPDTFKEDHQWILSATTPDGRFAYLGFLSAWYNPYYDAEYNQRKVYVITDRPVYRPGQPVRFKFWVRHAKYDPTDESVYANQSFTVQLNNPQGERILETNFTSDAYGGFAGEWTPPDDAMLGVYSLAIPNLGGSSFRVEEYKKPEFEVTVEAPAEPVMLGDRIEATIKARYYFGAPVTQAKVKYKIQRSTRTEVWYPVGLWDWFYGPGYWWFACDYDWWPGWKAWGCPRPHPAWIPWNRTPPELVADGEAAIGEDGTLKIPIDTAVAKAMHGDTDHQYTLTAEVTDASRRTLVGTGNVIAALRPFKVTAWTDRGYYRAGDTVQAAFSARTPDGKPVKGTGRLTLFRVHYKQDQPMEEPVDTWDLDTDDQGTAAQKMRAARKGQYRLSYTVTDARQHAIEGGYVFTVMGDRADEGDFRFNALELLPDRREYQPEESVQLRINTDQADSTVLLFIRPANGVCTVPKVLRLQGKSAQESIPVAVRDMPNFFIEALTVTGGRVQTETREIIVPPEKRVLNLEVLPSAATYKPGEKASARLKVTDFRGAPFKGSLVVSIYDKSVEYISGGSNVPEIREFFWKWRRQHTPRTESSLDRWFGNLLREKEPPMQPLGVFGHTVADLESDKRDGDGGGAGWGRKRTMPSARGSRQMLRVAKSAAVEEMSVDAVAAPASVLADEMNESGGIGDGDDGATGAEVAPTLRSKFADTALWVGSLETDANGLADVSLSMPENLTTWKIRAWALGQGTRVGEGSVEVVTAKNLILRLQAPRFFVEKDEVVLSANIHNYLPGGKSVRAVLELDGPALEAVGKASREVTVDAGGEARVDWRVRVKQEGEAVVRMKALTDEESDAMEMRLPVYVHGMLKQEPFSGVIRPEQNSALFKFSVPAERRPEMTRLEVRYSPTLAGAMVDALPYLVDYPYGCTEQTLNRFLPTVITHKVLKDMGLDLKAIRDKRANLNAQEIGDDAERARQWKRLNREPVFDEAEVLAMVKEGTRRLAAMQIADGGWGWFSGWGEESWPHTTAVVVHGLQIAQQCGVPMLPGMLDRGVQWLRTYQAEQVRKLKRGDEDAKDDYRKQADALDALVYMVLVDAGIQDEAMRGYLYRDRTELPAYGLAMIGIAFHRQGYAEQRDMVIRNLRQFVVEDAENQTAWLNLGNGGYWWCWYGSEYEAHAYYLKLLAATNPKDPQAAGLVKYLLNNRKHATYWNSTRDTALCIEAFADYLRASNEHKPDMTVQVLLDGAIRKEVRITPETLFTYDNKLVETNQALAAGEHVLEVRRQGTGPVYLNAYLENFTLEDFITKAGLEIKVDRKCHRLIPASKTVKAAGSHGQALDQKVEKYTREPLESGATLKSGDLVEVELEIQSKNDYEYVVFEDMKAAGFEPVDVRSGYTGNDMGAYVEFRDERVAFFVRTLSRGRHSVSYRLRAEIPGSFSALPTRAHAMYAPELKANSDEIKLSIED